MRHILEKILTVLVAMSLNCYPQEAAAEVARPSNENPLSYISRLGPVLFNQGGAALFPLSVLSGIRNGRVSPMMQYILMNHTMSSCVKDVLKRTPARRDPYVKARAMFDDGVCRIKKCFQQAMILGLLSSTSENPRTGGSSDPQRRQGNQQQAIQMLTAFQKDEGCGGEGNSGGGFDPMLLMLLQQGPQAQAR